MSVTSADATPPRLFISYCWTSEDHKRWVLELATGLRENGVDVILDRWHLLDGQDTHMFMERMVNDPEIRHVALICDRKYVEKANSRQGGVGTEAQIITPSVYSSHQQTKFVAVVTELDESGKPYVPTYYSAKKWIGFLEPSTYADDFDTLMRWVYDKPLDKPPPLGKPPAFLIEDERTIKLATTSLGRRAAEAMKAGKVTALPALIEYLDRVVAEFEKLRIAHNPKVNSPFDEEMMASVEGFLPYRNELVSVFVTAAIYTNEPPYWEALHRFFEHLIPFQDRPRNMNGWNEIDFDNFRFIIHELFLYLIAVYLKYDKFSAVEYFLSELYYGGTSPHSPYERMKDYCIFWSHSRLLEFRKDRLKLNVWDLQSQLFKDRSGGQPVEFEHVQAADIILWFRSCAGKTDRSSWFPFTFVFIDHFYPILELFARAQSTRHLNKIMPLLGVADLGALMAKVQELDSDRSRLQAGYHRVTAGQLMGIDKIGTLP